MKKKKMPKQQPATSKQAVGTPLILLDAVRRRLKIADFVIDLAATKGNRVTERYYSRKENGLAQSWPRAAWCWLNPEFNAIEKWLSKVCEEAYMGSRIAVLVPAAVGANWWAKYVHRRARVLFLNGRVTFVGHKQGYPKDCAVLLYEPPQEPRLAGGRGYSVWRWHPRRGKATLASRRGATGKRATPSSKGGVLPVERDRRGHKRVAA